MFHLWQAEWLLFEKVDFDGANKIIKVYDHVTTLDIREDVWSAWVRWVGLVDRNYSRYELAMERTGLDAIPGGQTGDFYFLTNGWKLLVDFSKVAVKGVLFSRDFDTAYYTYDLTPQYAAEVSSIVNTTSTVQNIVTGDLSSVPSIEEIATAVWGHITRTLTSQQSGITAQDVWDHADAINLKQGIAFIRGIEGGKWEIVGSQMIFYGEDNTTEIARFDIDDVNNPTSRTRV